jgi:hypothetical protein
LLTPHGGLGGCGNTVVCTKEAQSAAIPSSIWVVETEFGVNVTIGSIIAKLTKLVLLVSNSKGANLGWLANAYCRWAKDDKYEAQQGQGTSSDLVDKHQTYEAWRLKHVYGIADSLRRFP